MTTSAITTPQSCFVPPPVLDTGDGEARSNLTAHAATEPGSPLSNAAGAHHSRSLTLTSAVDPCSRVSPPRGTPVRDAEIAIERPATELLPAGSFPGGFRTPAPRPVPTCATASIRNPSQNRPLLGERPKGSTRP